MTGAGVVGVTGGGAAAGVLAGGASVGFGDDDFAGCGLGFGLAFWLAWPVGADPFPGCGDEVCEPWCRCLVAWLADCAAAAGAEVALGAGAM